MGESQGCGRTSWAPSWWDRVILLADGDGGGVASGWSWGPDDCQRRSRLGFCPAPWGPQHSLDTDLGRARACRPRPDTLLVDRTTLGVQRHMFQRSWRLRTVGVLDSEGSPHRLQPHVQSCLTPGTPCPRPRTARTEKVAISSRPKCDGRGGVFPSTARWGTEV